MPPFTVSESTHTKGRRASFWEVILREVRGCAAEDLVLHLQPPLLSTQLDQLGLLGGGQTIADSVVDVGLGHPAAHRVLGHAEVDRNLRDRQITSPSDRDHVTLELIGELLGHRDILPARHRRAHRMSTEPTADPSHP